MSIKKIFTFAEPKNTGLCIKKYVQHSLNKNRKIIYAQGRSDVRGSGKKKRRQKGTGSARMSDGFAPQFRGGGVAFGPNGRKYHIGINKKEKQLALKGLLYNKLNSDLLLVEKKLDFTKINTKEAKKWIDSKKLVMEKRHRILFIDDEFTTNFKKSVSNLRETDILPVCAINALSLIRAHYVCFSQKAIDMLNKRLGSK